MLAWPRFATFALQFVAWTEAAGLLATAVTGSSGLPSSSKRCYYPPFASIAKGEVFVLLYVFLFFCFFVCSVNDFSATRGPIHAIFCMRA